MSRAEQCREYLFVHHIHKGCQVRALGWDANWLLLGRFTLPDGQLFQMSYVADENGFQPESSFLPVAPEFPHEIPQFVLDQIAKAREEEKDSPRQPSSNYATP